MAWIQEEPWAKFSALEVAICMLHKYDFVEKNDQT